MESYLKGKRIFVTGACGTIGRELVRQLLADHEVGELIGIDNNESELFFLEQHLSQYPNARFFLADVRDGKKLGRLMKHMQIVFHTAAFKHVIFCERSPYEAIQTNINGVQNIISAANREQFGTCGVYQFGQGGQPNECHGHVQTDGRKADDSGKQQPKKQWTAVRVHKVR